MRISRKSLPIKFTTLSRALAGEDKAQRRWDLANWGNSKAIRQALVEEGPTAWPELLEQWRKASWITNVYKEHAETQPKMRDVVGRQPSDHMVSDTGKDRVETAGAKKNMQLCTLIHQSVPKVHRNMAMRLPRLQRTHCRGIDTASVWRSSYAAQQAEKYRHQGH